MNVTSSSIMALITFALRRFVGAWLVQYRGTSVVRFTESTEHDNYISCVIFVTSVNAICHDMKQDLVGD